MSYQVIARKWRPQTFEEVTGQEAVTRTLRNAVQYERLHHAYLFSGARGVGKTTTARLLAKALNCHKTDRPNPIPCSPNDKEPCVSCIEIAEGRSIDVLEIDAASHTGIDDVRDTILESININPARDRYKVFIIDEVHQLSKPAFNALLKTLEEPPPTVVFVMATTELHKVPDTILSRCQEFEFKTIALNKIFDSLKNIATVEKVNISDAALKEVARAGEGSMRDAQSAFDQVISFSGEKIEAEDVVNALGIAGVDILLRAVKGIAEHNTIEAFEIVEDLTSRGHDLRSFCRDLLSFFRDLMVAKVAANAEGLLDWAAVSREDLKKQAEQFSEADLLRFFNSLADTETQLRTAAQPRYILEIGLVKLMEMRRVASLEKIIERLAALENGNTSSAGETESPKTSAASSTSSGAAGAPAEKKTEFLDNLLKKDAEEDLSPAQASEPSEEPVKTAPPKIEESKPPEGVTQNDPSRAYVQAKSATEENIRTQPPNVGPQNIPVYSPPPASYASAAGAAGLALQFSAEDFVHIDDSWLDNAYERALLREGDDLSVELSLDLSSLAPETRFVPPPRIPEAAAPVVALAAAPKPPTNGGTPAAPVAPVASVTPAPVKKAAAPEKKLAERIKTALNQKGKGSLAKAFEEVSRVQTGNGEIVFFLPDTAEYWKAILESPDNMEIIAPIVKDLLGQALSIDVRIDGRQVGLTVPTTAELEKNREAAPELWLAAQEDPAIKQVLTVFRGQIIDVRKTASE
ncbi:MAG TPA: DNA polymerase III subunit gamma/tau [Pyrinomonadaceae bacterium]|jgi:DNA polymerase-3 subunit gamma/tau|nr:DNA polymerase III subunit gamma/tau [Pyrinomonadaceae bacterium]